MFGDHKVFIHLGTNLGKKRKNLKTALEHLESFSGTICSFSSIYETAAWGKSNQPDFLNQAIELSTKLPPFELLYELQLIEQKMGRERIEKWGERIIDLDILFYDDIIIDYQQLTIPHPLIEQRRFVLEPLLEIVKNFVHPVHGSSIQELANSCSDQSQVLQLRDDR